MTLELPREDDAVLFSLDDCVRAGIPYLDQPFPLQRLARISRLDREVVPVVLP